MASKVVGYCVKHKGKIAMKDPTLHRMEGRGRLGYAAKGSCPQDGTGMFKIMSEGDYNSLKAAGLKEGATIRKKAKSGSKGKRRSKSGGSSSASTSGGRRKRRSGSKGRKRSRSRSKGKK